MQFIDGPLRTDVRVCPLGRRTPSGSDQAPHAFDDEFDGGLPAYAGWTILNRTLEGVQRIDETSRVIWATHGSPYAVQPARR